MLNHEMKLDKAVFFSLVAQPQVLLLNQHKRNYHLNYLYLDM